MSGPDPSPGLNPRLVIAGALTAGSGHLMLFLLFAAAAGGVSSSLYALAGLLANGTVFALLASRLGSAPAERLGLVRPPSIAALAVLLLLGSLLLTSELDNLMRAFLMPDELRAELERAAREPDTRSALLRTAEMILILFAVLPVVYELLFRGIVQPVLVERFGALRGIALVSGIEALAAFLSHPNLPYDMPEVFATGLVLGVLRHTSGSLLAAIALRALMGAVGVAASFELFGIPGFDDLDAPHTPVRWLFAGALGLALGLWLCARMGQTRPTAGA
jgi:membrane protease YdiL (CAAX protease family)